jgi:hypothetical protein
MDADDFEKSGLWSGRNNLPGHLRIEHYHPLSFAVIDYGEENWMFKVRKAAGEAKQITIRNFESSLSNFKFADDIVMKHSYNWRFSDRDLILERPRTA